MGEEKGYDKNKPNLNEENKQTESNSFLELLKDIKSTTFIQNYEKTVYKFSDPETLIKTKPESSSFEFNNEPKTTPVFHFSASPNSELKKCSGQFVFKADINDSLSSKKNIGHATFTNHSKQSKTKTNLYPEFLGDCEIFNLTKDVTIVKRKLSLEKQVLQDNVHPDRKEEKVDDKVQEWILGLQFSGKVNISFDNNISEVRLNDEAENVNKNSEKVENISQPVHPSTGAIKKCNTSIGCGVRKNDTFNTQKNVLNDPFGKKNRSSPVENINGRTVNNNIEVLKIGSNLINISLQSDKKPSSLLKKDTSSFQRRNETENIVPPTFCFGSVDKTTSSTDVKYPVFKFNASPSSNFNVKFVSVKDQLNNNSTNSNKFVSSSSSGTAKDHLNCNDSVETKSQLKELTISYSPAAQASETNSTEDTKPSTSSSYYISFLKLQSDKEVKPFVPSCNPHSLTHPGNHDFNCKTDDSLKDYFKLTRKKVAKFEKCLNSDLLNENSNKMSKKELKNFKAPYNTLFNSNISYTKKTPRSGQVKNASSSGFSIKVKEISTNNQKPKYKYKKVSSCSLPKVSKNIVTSNLHFDVSTSKESVEKVSTSLKENVNDMGRMLINDNVFTPSPLAKLFTKGITFSSYHNKSGSDGCVEPQTPCWSNDLLAEDYPIFTDDRFSLNSSPVFHFTARKNLINQDTQTNKMFDWTPVWKVLECPVCYLIPMDKIFLCHKGHNICKSCKSELKVCPLCESEYSNSRNYILEQTISHIPLPCKYQYEGCNEELTFAEKLVHEKVCTFKELA